jgi:hypothetical protein
LTRVCALMVGVFVDAQDRAAHNNLWCAESVRECFEIQVCIVNRRNIRRMLAA